MDRNNATYPTIGLSFSAKIAAVLIVSILAWSFGLPTLLERVRAADLTSIQDTLASSDLGYASKHTIQFTTFSNVGDNQSISIHLDATILGQTGTSAFSEIYSLATTSDIYVGTSTPHGYAIVSPGGCTTGNQIIATGNYNNGTDENLNLQLCPSDPTIIGSTTPVTIVVGATTPLWTNPASTGSYRISVITPYDTGETQVAVLPNVTLTASVNTSFSFSVTGVATGTTLYLSSTVTTGSTTATSLPFSTLVPLSQYVLAQQLNVQTNARNGFSVTAQESQPPTSSTGATIALFANGATSTYPIAWTAPTSQIGVPSTYGHIGITSDDADEGTSTNTNEFSNADKWAGNFDQPRIVFSNGGVADGTTQNIGLAKVAYQIEIGPLQAAGNDYTNTITYVATPIF